VVADAGHVDFTLVETGHHLLALEHRADQTWAEKVTREASKNLDTFCLDLSPVVPHCCYKSSSATFISFFGLFLNVVNIVEVEDSQLAEGFGRLT